MYKTGMASDFFTIKGLETRTGISSHNWGHVVIKEILDNALDAVEAATKKEIVVSYDIDERRLQIFDSGAGLSVADVQLIYDFRNYVSKNRHIINISRGKQGNGLKTVIGISQLQKYQLTWHTNENKAISLSLNTENAQDGELIVTLDDMTTPTDKRGVELAGISCSRLLPAYMSQFADCNRDVRFVCIGFNDNYVYEPTAEPVNRQAETSLLFYDFNEFKRLLSVQDNSRYYKDFLGEYFGTRTKNASRIKGKISVVDMAEVERDFIDLQQLQNKKPLTLLKKHVIGYEHRIEQYPYIVEYQAVKSDEGGATVTVNNSVTYRDGGSVAIPKKCYKTGGKRETYADYLSAIISSFEGYFLDIHIITPRPQFRDTGKTVIELNSGITDALVDHMRRHIKREKRTEQEMSTKTPSQRALAIIYMDDAYDKASDGGKYNITARQMFYKLRELIGDDSWETCCGSRYMTANGHIIWPLE